MSSRARRAVAIVTSAALLAGCVTTQAGRIGLDDGSDPCRSQVVQLDSTGNFFGEAIIQGAAVGAVGGAILGGLIAAAAGGRRGNIATGAAIGAVAGGVTGAAAGYYNARRQQAADQAQLNSVIAGDLAKENAELDRTQLAFNMLMDCRFASAGRVRNDLNTGRISRAQAEALMANYRALMQRDVQLAQTINQRISTRGAEFDTAIESIAPGTKDRVLAGARVGRTVPSQARSAVVLKLRPDASAPEVTRVNAREPVTVQSVSGGFALVETASGVRGYAPASAFPGAQQAAARPSVGAGQDGDVRSLGASNIARRDNFNESVVNAERAIGAGFELAG
jgi:outer membrane lipoprotein SlyB